jgi:glycosyltransferase involved in cell wall biosynthesis
MVGHDHALLGLAPRLGAKIGFHVHDYACFCPRISLLGVERRYCGEPVSPAECDACVADAGSALRETIGVAALRARSASDFAAAARVVVPSQDTASRLRRHFPAIRPLVAPLDDDTALPPKARVAATLPRRVAVVGAIGPEKGYDVLLACARDAAWRGLALEFIVVGHTSDDRRLLDTGRAFITGRYDDAEAPALIRAQGAQVAFLPSIWPETWCFALGIAWRAGLSAVVFDIGAQADRVRATGRGWVLPLGLPPVAINNALLSVRAEPGDV